jgi:hypothetical protein
MLNDLEKQVAEAHAELQMLEIETTGTGENWKGPDTETAHRRDELRRFVNENARRAPFHGMGNDGIADSKRDASTSVRPTS